VLIVLNAAIDDKPVISSKKLKYLKNYANYKSVVKKKEN